MSILRNDLLKTGMRHDILGYKDVVVLRRPKNLKRKLFLLGLFAAVMLLWLLLRLPCIPRLLTRLICPGCGMTRAWGAVLRLDLAGAFASHPMFWSVPVLIWYAFYDGRPLNIQWLNNGLLALLVLGWVVCYILRLVAFLGGSLII